MDTLTRLCDSVFSGGNVRVAKEKNNGWLVFQNRRRVRKVPLDTVKNVVEAFSFLNRVYFLDGLSIIFKELNNLHKMYYFSYWDRTLFWQNVKDKSMEPMRFRDYAKNALAKIKDSLCLVHDQYTSIVSYVSERIDTIDYSELKTCLEKLPEPCRYNGYRFDGYWYAAIRKVPMNRPESFFKTGRGFSGA